MTKVYGSIFQDFTANQWVWSQKKYDTYNHVNYITLQ